MELNGNEDGAGRRLPNALPGHLVAHRGCAARYPENTLAAVAAALQEGACCVEVDVQLSADRVPVLMHDNGSCTMSPPRKWHWPSSRVARILSRPG